LVKEFQGIKQPPARIEMLYKGHKISLSISLPIDLFNRGMQVYEKCYGDQVAIDNTSTIFSWLIHQGIVRLMEIFPEKFAKREMIKKG